MPPQSTRGRDGAAASEHEPRRKTKPARWRGPTCACAVDIKEVAAPGPLTFDFYSIAVSIDVQPCGSERFTDDSAFL